MRRSLVVMMVGLCSCREEGCFGRGTRVRTPRGDRAIEELVVGDDVLAFRSEDGGVVVRRVEAVHRHMVSRVLVLETEGREIITTGEHPFWDGERREWVPARELREDVALARIQDDGRTTRPTRITSVREEVRSAEVFNLTVEGPEHTYFASGIAVHNKSLAAPAVPMLINEADVPVEVRVLTPVAGIAVDARMVGQDAVLPLPSALFGGAETTALLAPDGELLTRGRLTVLRANTAKPTDALVIKLPNGSGFWLVLGPGPARLRRVEATGTIELVSTDAQTTLQLLDLPKVAACAAEAPKLELPEVLPRDRSTIGSQVYDGSCFALELLAVDSPTDPSTSMKLCLPEAAWPFVVGDEVRFSRDEPTQGALRVEGTSTTVELSQFGLGLNPASLSIAGAVMDVEPSTTCATIDTACGLVTVPALLRRRGMTEGPLPFNQPISITEKTTAWLLSASVTAASRADCVAKGNLGTAEVIVITKRP